MSCEETVYWQRSRQTRSTVASHLPTPFGKSSLSGGKSGSTELLDWAQKELSGYRHDADLPDYRVVGAPIAIDGLNLRWQFTQQRISPSQLPEFTHGDVREEFRLTGGVGELEAMLKDAHEGAVKPSLPMGADLVNLLNQQNPGQTITALYWVVSTTAIHSCLDRIRTALVSMIAEIRVMSPGDENPSAAATDQAVNIVINGGKRAPINVNTAIASGESASTVQAQPQETSQKDSWWTRSRKIGALIVGVATIAGAVFALFQVQGWHLF